MNYNSGYFLLLFFASSVAGKDLRLVNGVDVDITDYPYQVLLRTESVSCGASIIGANWALTSAACIDGAEYGVIRAGITKRNLIGSRHDVLNFYVHPNWVTFGSYDYDYGLVEVEEPFKLNSPGIAPIQLAEEPPEIGTMLTVSGWGSNSYSGSSSVNLQAAKLSVVSNQTCQAAYGKLPITDRMLCAGSNTQGTCQGDSGGPLVDQLTGIQYGIVSFIPKACSPTTPSVFADVANQRDWIRNITGI